MSKSLKIHVYIGSPAGNSNAEWHGDIIANKESSDVNNAYNISGNHRFDAWIDTNRRGDQPIYIYAINSEGGYNPVIGSKTVIIDEVNHDPVGYLERVEFENGKIRVKGWAYDSDDSSKSLPIHVYIGGKAGSGAECHVIKSAIERSDVNSYYKISGIHGFDEWIETSAWGETPVYVYAINNEDGYNPCIGDGTVTVDKLESFNDDPSGAVDRIEGDKGKIHVKGWAYDPDCNGKSLQIHVYIGGKAGSGAHCYRITADVERPDINSYRRIPGDHGFDAWIETTVYGEQPVYIYAINNEGGNNPCIGNGTVTIEKTESNTNLTIYYNANGGSTNNSDYSILSNGKIYKSGSLLNEVWANGYGHPNGLYNASTLGLYRESYEFLGWSLTPDADRIFGEDEKITSNDLYPNIYKADASIELYARWKAISATENNYPVVSYDLSYSSRQFRLKWTAVDGAEKYGIAVYQSGGWRVKVQVNSNTTTYTSPKMKSGSYKMVVCAKVNGEWDTSKIKSRAFTVEIK